MKFSTRRKKPEAMSKEQRIAAVVDEICSRPQVATQLNNAVDPKWRQPEPQRSYKNRNRVNRHRMNEDRAQKKPGIPDGGWL